MENEAEEASETGLSNKKTTSMDSRDFHNTIYAVGTLGSSIRFPHWKHKVLQLIRQAKKILAMKEELYTFYTF